MIVADFRRNFYKSRIRWRKKWHTPRRCSSHATQRRRTIACAVSCRTQKGASRWTGGRNRSVSVHPVCGLLFYDNPLLPGGKHPTPLCLPAAWCGTAGHMQRPPPPTQHPSGPAHRQNTCFQKTGNREKTRVKRTSKIAT